MNEETKNKIIKEIIRRVILNTNESHRLVVQDVLDEEFINFSIDFFKRIVDKKLSGGSINVDWYKKEFLNEKLNKDDIANNAGLNIKTITNTYNTASKPTVIQASLEHYETFCNTIERLIKEGGDLEIELTIKFKGVENRWTKKRHLLKLSVVVACLKHTALSTQSFQEKF